MKKKTIKLSFENDDEEDSHDVSDLPKSGTNKPLGGRRIKQAEVKILVAETSKPIISSGEYDLNSLQKLKQEQKFVSDPLLQLEAKGEEMEVAQEVILNGDDAELLEKNLENPQDLTKEERILLKQVEEKNKKKKSRIFLNEFGEDDNSRRNIDMNQSEVDQGWEKEMMRRGGIYQPESTLLSQDFSSSDSYHPNVSDIIKLVEGAYEKLQELVQRDEREIEQIKSELLMYDEEIEKLNKEKAVLIDQQLLLEKDKGVIDLSAEKDETAMLID